MPRKLLSVVPLPSAGGRRGRRRSIATPISIVLVTLLLVVLLWGGSLARQCRVLLGTESSSGLLGGCEPCRTIDSGCKGGQGMCIGRKLASTKDLLVEPLLLILVVGVSPLPRPLWFSQRHVQGGPSECVDHTDDALCHVSFFVGHKAKASVR